MGCGRKVGSPNEVLTVLSQGRLVSPLTNLYSGPSLRSLNTAFVDPHGPASPPCHGYFIFYLLTSSDICARKTVPNVFKNASNFLYLLDILQVSRWWAVRSAGRGGSRQRPAQPRHPWATIWPPQLLLARQANLMEFLLKLCRVIIVST